MGVAVTTVPPRAVGSATLDDALADPDLVARSHRGRRHPGLVDPGPVGRSQVLELDVGPGGAQAGVTRRDLGVIKDDVSRLASEGHLGLDVDLPPRGDAAGNAQKWH